jgi:plasmid stabilization system protein ParE
MGHEREELAGMGLKVWTVGNYLLLYRPESKPLEIARVIHGYRDIERAVR